MIACQHPGCEAIAEYKVKEWTKETGEVYRYWYLCVLHLKEYFGPWLPKKLP